MGAYVDEAAWRSAVREPDWYLHIREQYESLLAVARRSDRATAARIAGEVYSFFEQVLADGAIAIGGSEPDWDAERRTVDTAVIHHTGLPPGITWQRLDAIHLTRIYARYYADPEPAEVWIRGLPVRSGHERGGREVFYAYHWLVRIDGGLERLLKEHETGWHAGNWDVNCRSVGICIDCDLRDADPPPPVIATVATLLREQYPAVVPAGVVGHREVNPRTTCPGEGFLARWKGALLERAFGEGA